MLVLTLVGNSHALRMTSRLFVGNKMWIFIVSFMYTIFPEYTAITITSQADDTHLIPFHLYTLCQIIFGRIRPYGRRFTNQYFIFHRKIFSFLIYVFYFANS